MIAKNKSAPAPVGELPRLSMPALRALASAGITGVGSRNDRNRARLSVPEQEPRARHNWRLDAEHPRSRIELIVRREVR